MPVNTHAREQLGVQGDGIVGVDAEGVVPAAATGAGALAGAVRGGEAHDAQDGAPTFQQAFIAMPCQILRSGRRIVYRLMGWNP